jgi:dienelactone hydrolase
MMLSYPAKIGLRMKALVVVALLCMTLGPAAAKAVSDLERTWVHASVAAPTDIPGVTAYFRMETKEGKAFFRQYQGGEKPVVVYLHGCRGFNSSDRKIIRQIAGAGYFVVAPDSMARRYRPRQCSGQKKKGGHSPFVYDFRQAEINYAIDQLWQQPWVDWDNLFIMGISEGGVATALYRGHFFRARVITQWTCHGAPMIRGLEGPKDTPVLAVVRKNDPWYNREGSGQAGHCGAFFDGRPNSESLQLEDGKNHNVMKDSGVIEKIIDFLNVNQKRPAIE